MLGRPSLLHFAPNRCKSSGVELAHLAGWRTWPPLAARALRHTLTQHARAEPAHVLIRPERP
eukprot:3165110-Alexandrium_andersonii.AAC.1